MTEFPVMAGADGRISNSAQGWIGNSAMAGGKAYAALSHGLVHYRATGPENGLPVLLIHQTPWSMVQYIGAQQALADLGLRSIAPDTPGYGMSDPPAGQPHIRDYADYMVELLDHLAIERCAVAGHHSGASIAACLAAHHANRVSALILHGVPAFDANERAERLTRPPYQRVLRADGTHLSEHFKRVYDYTGTTAQNLVTTQWQTICFYLCGASDIAYNAVFSHDTLADISALTVPTLLLTDKSDALHQQVLDAAKMRPDFALKIFSGGSPFALMNEPDRWASIVADFAVTYRDRTS